MAPKGFLLKPMNNDNMYKIITGNQRYTTRILIFSLVLSEHPFSFLRSASADRWGNLGNGDLAIDRTF